MALCRISKAYSHISLANSPKNWMGPSCFGSLAVMNHQSTTVCDRILTRTMSTAPAIVANGSIQSDTTQTHIRAFSKMTPAPLSNTGKKQGSHHRAYSTARSAADDEITSTVRQVVKKYVKALDENWKEIHLASPSLKFRIVRDAMFATGRYVSNVELTNVFKVDHLIKLLGTDRAPNVFNPYDGRNEVEQLLSEKKKDRSLPPNITYSNTSIYKPRVQSPPVLRARMPSIVRATLTCK